MVKDLIIENLEKIDLGKCTFPETQIVAQAIQDKLNEIYETNYSLCYLVGGSWSEQFPEWYQPEQYEELRELVEAGIEMLISCKE